LYITISIGNDRGNAVDGPRRDVAPGSEKNTSIIVIVLEFVIMIRPEHHCRYSAISYLRIVHRYPDINANVILKMKYIGT